MQAAPHPTWNEKRRLDGIRHVTILVSPPRCSPSLVFPLQATGRVACNRSERQEQHAIAAKHMHTHQNATFSYHVQQQRLEIWPKPRPSCSAQTLPHSMRHQIQADRLPCSPVVLAAHVHVPPGYQQLQPWHQLKHSPCPSILRTTHSASLSCLQPTGLLLLASPKRHIEHRKKIQVGPMICMTNPRRPRQNSTQSPASKRRKSQAPNPAGSL
jgi:hypothetical protein